MITSLASSLARVTAFWYVLGVLVLFLGKPQWAEDLYSRLSVLPWVPELVMNGIHTAAQVQLRLLLYWTAPMLLLWACAMAGAAVFSEIRYRLTVHTRETNLKPKGVFWGVKVPQYSLGSLPRATTPSLAGERVSFSDAPAKGGQIIQIQGAIADAVKLMTPVERQLAEELIQLLLVSPGHYAGLGHGVGLLEHTFNVVTEAAAKCTPEFRLPFLAALSHDIGKLITFQPDGKGGWVRKGLHSRESARILATLPGYQALPPLHQKALLLAVKYDHAPKKMPELMGDREANMLAMRIISALSVADRAATAAEKERHLERLQPEDLLWQDFKDFLREAPVVQLGKPGVANQVNNPVDSPYLYVYEAPWRDAAVRRLPAEVAAALDLSRRDTGRLAKYTRILVERLKKEGLLVDEVEVKTTSGSQVMRVSTENPLWDIQSGKGDKAIVLRGILVLRAEELWKALNYRVGVKSPYPVQILAPNADSEGHVNQAPRATSDMGPVPDVSDGLKLTDPQNADVLAEVGLMAGSESSSGAGAASAKPKTRAKGAFKPVQQPSVDDTTFGFTPAKTKVGVKQAEQEGEAPKAAADEAKELPISSPAEPAQDSVVDAGLLDSALAYLSTTTDGGSSEAAEVDVPAVDEAPGVVESEPAAIEPDGAPVAEEAPSADEVVPAASPESDGQSNAARPNAKARRPQRAPAASGGNDFGLEQGLSRAERREGLAMATTEADLEKYPHLKLGDKFYTEQSRAVQAGLKKPGSKYQGDNREKQIELSEAGPRRVRRRPQ